VVKRRRPQNGPDPRGQIPHLPAEVGHRRLRAYAALEEQRLHQQEQWQEAREEQDGFEQDMRLSIEAEAPGDNFSSVGEAITKSLGLDERAVLFWERKQDRRPPSAPNGGRIEQALLDHGVIHFAEPSPGARLAK